MARKLRVQYQGAIYHVTLRGVEQRLIFTAHRERERFLQRLADGIETHNVRLYLFCLMPNHAHLVVETPRANLDRFMHGLETAYTVYFNLRHGRSGHLMQGRYGAVLVQGDQYLLRLTRYLHLNPVCAGKAKHMPIEERRELLRKYRWSSYRSYVRRTEHLPFVDYAPMLAMTGAKRSAQAAAYRRFVEAGLAKTDEEFIEVMKESPLAIGSETFRAWVADRHQELLRKHNRAEDVSFRRVGQLLPVSAILSIVCKELGVEAPEIRRHRKGNHTRPIAAQALCKYGGLTQREAAEVLGLGTGAAVSAQLKWLKGASQRNQSVGCTLRRIEARLSQRLQ